MIATSSGLVDYTVYGVAFITNFLLFLHRAEEQDKRMKEVRKKLKQMAKKKREEQVRMKKTEKKLKKLKGYV